MSEIALDAEAVHSLVGSRMWREITVVDTTGSTNRDLAAALQQGAAPGAVLIAREQTGGRGRRDRTWSSPPGTSLAISLAVAPAVPRQAWGWFPLLTGMAVHDALAPLHPAVELKWPNDVLINQRKVCGILLERVDGPGMAQPCAVVGIGINVAQTEAELPVPTATSLAIEGIHVTGTELVAAVLTAMQKSIEDWQQGADLRAAYLERCASVGRELEVIVSPEETVRGTGAGIDEFGQLLVKTAAGVRSFAAADVVHARLQ